MVVVVQIECVLKSRSTTCFLLPVLRKRINKSAAKATRGRAARSQRQTTIVDRTGQRALCRGSSCEPHAVVEFDSLKRKTEGNVALGRMVLIARFVIREGLSVDRARAELNFPLTRLKCAFAPWRRIMKQREGGALATTHHEQAVPTPQQRLQVVPLAERVASTVNGAVSSTLK